MMKSGYKISGKYSSGPLAAILLAAILAMVSCIKNDIPYPRIQPNILSLEVENQSQASAIDSVSRTATVYLNEYADIYNVEVLACEISPGARFEGDSIYGVIDLSVPRVYMIQKYQLYDWTVKAVQTIERYFTISGQIGTTAIDVPGHRIVVTMPESADLTALKVTSAKLGSPSATVIPVLEGATIDLSSPLTVVVTDFGRSEEWTIYVEVSASTVTTVRADGWTNVAWVYGEAQEGRDNDIEYRKAADSEWIRVPEQWMTYNGGSFHARILHLQSLTDYVARAVSGDEYGMEIEFTTGVDLQVPDCDFDNWWLDGKVWCPWAQGGVRYWDTGNKGATTLGSSNTYPIEDTPTGTGMAASLETRFVGIGMIGKLAAGNIFVGEYVRTDGTNGILSFGRPFTERPTKLRGYMKYHSAPISSVTAGFENLRDCPDSCIVWTALIDADQPFEIRTNPNNRHLFDPEASDVIAYGKMECGYDVPEYQQFEFELQYKATDRVPKYRLIVASASKYGDYFTGGNGSLLCIDDLELLYDY